MTTLEERVSRLEGTFELLTALTARVDLLPTREEMLAAIRAHDSDIQTQFAHVQTQFAQIQTQFAQIQTQFAEVRLQIKESENRMIKWMVSLMLAQAGLTIAAASAVFALLKLTS